MGQIDHQKQNSVQRAGQCLKIPWNIPGFEYLSIWKDTLLILQYKICSYFDTLFLPSAVQHK